MEIYDRLFISKSINNLNYLILNNYGFKCHWTICLEVIMLVTYKLVTIVFKINLF